MKRRRQVCLWGFRRGDWSYEFVTGEFAWRHRLLVVGTHDFQRDFVTVLRRAS